MLVRVRLLLGRPAAGQPDPVGCLLAQARPDPVEQHDQVDLDRLLARCQVVRRPGSVAQVDVRPVPAHVQAVLQAVQAVQVQAAVASVAEHPAAVAVHPAAVAVVTAAAPQVAVRQDHLAVDPVAVVVVAAAAQPEPSGAPARAVPCVDARARSSVVKSSTTWTRRPSAAYRCPAVTARQFGFLVAHH